MPYDLTKRDPDRAAKTREILNGAKPAEVLITIQDALSIVKDKIPEEEIGLTRQQRELVEMVRTGLNTDLTDVMLHELADKDKDVWLGVHHGRKAGGYFVPDPKLVTVSDTQLGSEYKRQWILNHELAHGFQHLVWGIYEPTEGIRAIDKGFWGLLQEAQANLIAEAAMDPEKVSTPDKAFEYFVDYFKNRSDYHRKGYDLAKEAKEPGGIPISHEVLARTFGKLPGSLDNFLEGRFKSIDDMYRQIYCQDKDLNKIYESVVPADRQLVGSPPAAGYKP